MLISTFLMLHSISRLLALVCLSQWFLDVHAYPYECETDHGDYVYDGETYTKGLVEYICRSGRFRQIGCVTHRGTYIKRDSQHIENGFVYKCYKGLDVVPVKECKNSYGEKKNIGDKWEENFISKSCVSIQDGSKTIWIQCVLPNGRILKEGEKKVEHGIRAECKKVHNDKLELTVEPIVCSDSHGKFVSLGSVWRANNVQKTCKAIGEEGVVVSLQCVLPSGNILEAGEIEVEDKIQYTCFLVNEKDLELRSSTTITCEGNHKAGEEWFDSHRALRLKCNSEGDIIVVGCVYDTKVIPLNKPAPNPTHKVECAKNSLGEVGLMFVGPQDIFELLH